ncbi:hypothetical protein JTE90_001973 [Oedothorax gibbosus]|uniref:Meckelin n=1 Tax=Oedothorax gibbosus TaxID=931172 RepID=A0AAV6TYI5_9ARAC|nr:hypothetical protein JTE90_001973 [Oedothorax gibbosus]
MALKLVFSIVLLTLINLSKGNLPLPAITPEHCNATEYYDSICMRCTRCGKDETQANLQYRASDGSCVCKSHHYVKARSGPYDVTCDHCPKKMVPSADGRHCLECGDTNPYNETSDSCEPCSNGTMVEDGKYASCASCEDGDIVRTKLMNMCPSTPVVNQKYCSEANMVYSGGYCLPSIQNDASLFNIKYQNGESVPSAYLKEHLNAALHNCKENNATACQALANMCVLLLYRISLEINACAEFRKISKKHLEACPRKRLWLYYIDEEARWNAEKDLYQDNVPNVFTPNLGQESSKLHILAMKYALNGTLLGFKKIKSDDMHLCQESDVEVDIALVVGTRIERTCRKSLQTLWKDSEMVFYELYLVNNLNKSEMYPIPVLIQSVVVNGESVNIEKDRSKWLLVSRFFLTDHISGIEEGSSLLEKHNQPVTKVFRYASHVSLRVTFKSYGEPGKIFPPLLTITYAEATPGDYMENKKVTVKFSALYDMDQSSAMKSISIALSVLCIFAFGWSILQTYSWFRRSGKHAIDLMTLGKFLICMSGNISTVFFVVVLGSCLYWLTFFKRQDVIYTILPTHEQEEFINVYIGQAFAFKAIQLIHLLFAQCSIDIFFIDWERPRVRASTVSARVATTSKNVNETSVDATKKGLLKATPDKINTEMAGVSIWRTYYAANEWAEMQSKRKISLSLQLFGVLFVLKVLGFETSTLAALNLNLPTADVQKYVPYSTCCRFALGAIVYLVIALLQVIVRRGLYERFVEDKLQQYVDLCSVSNVSVFILVTKRFGYYIHGRSTHGKADVNMKEMHEFLRKEEEDLCGRRGLLPDTDQQTFQILLPPGVHDQFLRLLVPLTSYSQAADRMQGVGGRLAKVDIDRVANTHYMLNKFLSSFIDHSFKDLDYVVKDRVLMEYLFDVECYEVADRGYFYNDDGRSFSSVLFYGNEAVLLLFDVLLFSVINIASADYVLATILTFVIAKAIQGIRRSAGRRNLVRKALVDERFLT